MYLTQFVVFYTLWSQHHAQTTCGVAKCFLKWFVSDSNPAPSLPELVRQMKQLSQQTSKLAYLILQDRSRRKKISESITMRSLTPNSGRTNCINVTAFSPTCSKLRPYRIRAHLEPMIVLKPYILNSANIWQDYCFQRRNAGKLNEPNPEYMTP